MIKKKLDKLYSTEDCVQSPGIEHDGDDMRKECICLHYGVTLLYSINWHNIVNQLCFNKKYNPPKKDKKI